MKIIIKLVTYCGNIAWFNICKLRKLPIKYTSVQWLLMTLGINKDYFRKIILTAWYLCLGQCFLYGRKEHLNFYQMNFKLQYVNSLNIFITQRLNNRKLQKQMNINSTMKLWHIFLGNTLPLFRLIFHSLCSDSINLKLRFMKQ